MSTADEVVIEPPLSAPPARTADFPKTRLLYWSVRRELWENRSIYLAPLIVAGLMIVGFLLGAKRLFDGSRAIYTVDSARQAEMLAAPLGVTAIPIVVTAAIVAVFYCLDALHGERRDRSILFWKSLPVSDTVTVLSKALVPLVVLPTVTCLTVVLLQVVVLLVGSALLVAAGLDAAVLWTGLPIVRQWGALVYGVVGLVLWHAPLYGWLFVVSGWARRSNFLWAVLPPLACCLVERSAFETTVLWSLLKDRLVGFAGRGFVFEGHGRIAPDPRALLGSPDLWIGLVVAVACLAAAIWLRRYRQPI